LGFHVIGYGCTTCGGKSGPLKPAAQELHTQGRKLVAVLSGNRNFDGRIHRLVSASFLTSPAMVIIAALAGSFERDFGKDLLQEGKDVRLADLWPSREEVDDLVARFVKPETFAQTRGLDDEAINLWSSVKGGEGPIFDWDPKSTYIVEPPFFEDETFGFGMREPAHPARVLGFFEDGVTTDHVSPGGEIPAESPAGQYLQSLGIAPAQFNSYVGRRGNHHVMMRGTYANVRVRNRLVPDRDGWWTRVFPSGEIISFYEAVQAYRAAHVPMIVLGGRDFGSGSSRDWAAKGPALLGVGAVLAESFERIHRSNLIGLGIVPLIFMPSASTTSLGLIGSEEYRFSSFMDALNGDGVIHVQAVRPSFEKSFQMNIDARTPAERQLVLKGGVFRSTLERYA
jgi:aconitate hydratase